MTWQQVGAHSHTVQQSYAWTVIDQYVADPTWVPDDGSFLRTGSDAGDTKAAAGRSDTAAIAYFPSSRRVVVDTTVIAGTGQVRLRWYDPTTGEYTGVSASEAQQAGRSVPYPTSHADGSSDWTLVVDLASGSTPPTTTSSSTTTTIPPTTTSSSTTTTTTRPPVTTSTTTTLPSSTTTTTPGRAVAEPTFVQEVAQRVISGTSNSVSFERGNRDGDLIVVYVLWSNTGDVTVTDTNGNTYRAVGAPTTWNGGRARAAVFYAADIGAGPNVVTARFTDPITAFGIVYAHEYANVATVDPLDGSTSTVGTTTTVNSGTLRTTIDGGLLFVAAGSTDKVQLTDPTFTTRSDRWDNLTADASGQPTGTHTVAGTHNGTAWVTTLVAFKPATTTSSSTTTTIPPTTTSSSTTTTIPPTTTSSSTATTTLDRLSRPPRRRRCLHRRPPRRPVARWRSRRSCRRWPSG